MHTRRLSRSVTAVACTAALGLAIAPSARADELPPLEAGAGQADITPPKTGYYLGGWTRADRKVEGTQSRLWAKVMVLKRGDRKIALVSVNLFMVPGGWQRHIAQAVADLGYRVDNVLISASHTHAGPGGFANFPTLNTAAPNAGMILTDPGSLGLLLSPVSADRQLYTFLVQQVAAAIRDADGDLAPAEAGWANEQLAGVTENRSLEAHLANHGIQKEPRTGKASDDPGGYVDTIDPKVDVLRVDQVVDGERVPIGAWSQFANHGTVEKSEFKYYNADHHAAAMQVFEEGVRKEANVPPGRTVVNVYGNGAEGDQSAGLKYSGPAGAQEVGTIEAQSMLKAWRAAGTNMTATPDLDLRWTQACFCGQAVDGATSSKKGNPGVPFITGSEEGRGPLYDITKTAWEGVRSPIDLGGGQGRKIVVPVGEFPTSVPTMVVRIGDRVIATLPGEPTKEVGVRIKAAVLEASAGTGVSKVVISGLTNEYINYITTPEEYDAQNYEGASTMYGRQEFGVLRSSLVQLSSAMALGSEVGPGVPYDAFRGVLPDGPAYPAPAASGKIVIQPPMIVGRLAQATLSWAGGAGGRDMPVGEKFLRAERLEGGAWQEVASDMGLSMAWRMSSTGVYAAKWEVPFDAPNGTYRLVVTSPSYRLESRPFLVGASPSLKVSKSSVDGTRVTVRVGYADARENVDLTARPAGGVARGMITFNTYGGGRYVAPVVDGYAKVTVPGTVAVYVQKGAATDALGNTNPADVRVR